MSRHRLRAVGTTTALLLLGALVWAAAAFGVGRAGEDFCFADMEEHGYGAYRASGEWFPPDAACVLRGPTDPADPAELVVHHRVVAAAVVLLLLGLPVVWLVGTALVVRGVLTRAGPPRGGRATP